MPTGAGDRALGALHGLAVGDALGMPTESMSRADIAARYGVVDRLLPGAADQPVAPGLAAGSVTDDTEQAVLVARLLIAGEGGVEPQALAAALADWQEEMVARGSVDLLGPSTKRALESVRAGVDPREAGRYGTTNGAAMRIAPVGIATPADDLTALVDAVEAASHVTHNTGLGISAAAAVAAAVSAGVAGADLADSLDLAERAAELGARRGYWAAGGSIAARLRWARGWTRAMSPAELAEAVADVVGTSVASQESVVAALVLAGAYPTDPQAALVTAAGIGGDTDTIAAICGAVLGAHVGWSRFPAELAAMTSTVLEVNGLDLQGLVPGLLALRADAGCHAATTRESTSGSTPESTSGSTSGSTPESTSGSRPGSPPP